jgi:hypothetical protein
MPSAPCGPAQRKAIAPDSGAPDTGAADTGAPGTSGLKVAQDRGTVAVIRSVQMGQQGPGEDP